MTRFVLLDIFLILLSIFFPPLPVWMKAGLCSADSLINIALCCLGYFPGLIHAWYIISKYPEVLIIDIESQPDELVRTQRVYVNIASSPAPQDSHLQPYSDYGATAGPSELPPSYSDHGETPVDANQGKIQRS